MIEVVEELDDDLIRGVDEFLQEHLSDAEGTIEHDPRWLGVLRDGLGHRPYVVLTRKGAGSAAITGYLPLALVASRCFGRFLVSLPYLNRAGVVASAPHVAADLIDRAVELGEQLDVDYVELRHRRPFDHPRLGVSRADKYLMVAPLPADPASLWQSIGAKSRNLVRKGERHAPSIRWGGAGLVREFYALFARNMRDLGTPVFPPRLFTSMLETFRDEAEVAVVEHDRRPVAAALLIHEPERAGHAARTLTPSTCSSLQARGTNANVWMYHQLLLRAVERGSRDIDFGRSSAGSGSYHFKKQWGAEPRPTVWQYHLRRGEADTMRPEHPRHRRRIAAWRKLPVWLTRVIGPPIVRRIP